MLISISLDMNLKIELVFYCFLTELTVIHFYYKLGNAIAQNQNIIAFTQ
ncbi:hypothetical protein NIES4074_57050 [Cylindrospermum sp. NIES-4074]|nr:hypothetical protein NIES4074_57050 [Cylindrospermum sp. NIES-4074]